MADIVFKDFESTDIVAGKAKVKYFPAWSDVSSDSDTTQQSVLSSFFINGSQTGSVEGYYYWNIYQENPATIVDADSQFSIAYAHTGSTYAGSPAGVWNANIVGNSLGLGSEYNDIFPAWAIYRQLVNATTTGDAYTNLTYVSGTTTYTIANAYVISLAKGRVKDYVDQNTWQLNLSASNLVSLVAATASSTNQVEYNINLGNLPDYTGPWPAVNSTLTASDYTVGKFYADKGLFILDANKLFLLGAVSQSALTSGKPDTSTYYYTSSLVLKNFLGALIGAPPTQSSLGAGVSGSTATYFRARSVERVQSTHYFVRAKNSEFNRTTNPTWISGSDQEILPVFVDDPKTFITSVGLFDGAVGQSGTGQMVAIAKLSKPVQKSSDSEALIRVRLDF